MKTVFKFLAIIAIVSFGTLNAKEPTNWMIGIGGGYGQTSISVEHSHVIRNPIWNWNASAAPGSNFYYISQRWAAQQNMSLSSWSGAWEFLVGYKHFVNDWLGVRAYANIGVQHYKPSLFESKTDPIGIIDYTANVDLLFDFYETEKWAIGMVAGLGFGGTSFDKKAIEKYMAVYDRATGRPVGIANIQQHFLNVNASVGLRGVYFQKIRKVKQRVCDEFVEGKRTCRVPVAYIGHNFEINAKFPFMDYNATSDPDIIQVGVTSKTGANGTTTEEPIYASIPAYKVKNAYRITFRYIIDF